ncbi:rhamnulokinase [Streptomyces sp. t39]|uniref:rhamnulokinase n=1 Tax=Streptomyces sp. t39 TaxID=1828156 RepID=UPI0011CD8506|nr:rhamnulokinase family protein [Streptomyces sp. t39]TXS48877.1 rhamnulokinase [Streptomyces sp. t39]
MTTRPSSHVYPSAYAAVDLGATSGRVMLGRVGRGHLDLTEVQRFDNTPLHLADGLHWNITALFQSTLDGLRAAGAVADIASIGIDTWAVDYGLLDTDGTLIGPPYHYRDSRTAPVADDLAESLGARELYRITGLQHLPFNTIFQIAAHRRTAAFDNADKLLLIPDLLTNWLTGTLGTEETNASTTGLFDASSATWSPHLLQRLGVRPSLLPPLRRPGDDAGTLLPHVAAATSLPDSTPLTAVASHDTASAVAAVPAQDDHFAYISCGTWSLAGLELDTPVLTEASRQANFTNERGVDGTIRYLRNIMGLWLLEECRRAWHDQGLPTHLSGLLTASERAEPFASVIDPDDPSFLAPGDMPHRIRDFCRQRGQRVPTSQGAVVRCILESLALAHRTVFSEAAALARRTITRIHLVGGGSRNALLCQLTADATGLPVTAGPAEATAIGNVLVQARAAGAVSDLAHMRTLIADTQALREYTPRGRQADWDAAASRLRP